MKLEDLTDGLYVATCDVVNPHPDGRKRRDWTAEPLWRAGEQYTVRVRVDTEINREKPITMVEISRPGGYVRGAYWPGGRSSASTGAVALADSLEPVAVSTVAQALAATRRPYQGRDWQAILEYVIEHGGASFEAVRDALVLESQDEIRSDE